MNDPGGERRRSERLRIAIPVYVSGRTPDGAELTDFASIVNVSRGGALIAATRYVPSPMRIEMEIPASPIPQNAVQTSVRRLKGEVVRSQAGVEYHLIAVRFTEPLAS